MHNVLICVLLDSCCSLVSPALLWQSSSLGNLVLQCSDDKTDRFLHMCYERCAACVMVCCAFTMKCFRSPVESVNGFCGVSWYCNVQNILWFKSEAFSLHTYVVHKAWAHLKLVSENTQSYSLTCQVLTSSIACMHNVNLIVYSAEELCPWKALALLNCFLLAKCTSLEGSGLVTWSITALPQVPMRGESYPFPGQGLCGASLPESVWGGSGCCRALCRP